MKRLRRLGLRKLALRALDILFDIALFAAATATIVLIWTASIVALQAMASALFLGLVALFVLRAAEGRAQRVLPPRRDASQVEVPYDEVKDWPEDPTA